MFMSTLYVQEFIMSYLVAELNDKIGFYCLSMPVEEDKDASGVDCG
jgi:hypothetical protein